MIEQILEHFVYISSCLSYPFQNFRIKIYNSEIRKHNRLMSENELKYKYSNLKTDIQDISSKKCGRKIKRFFIDHKNQYNASTCGNTLYISSLWYKDIMQDKNINYFRQTLGHELIHFKYHDIQNPFCIYSAFGSIKSILKEVRADIEGYRLIGISKENAIESLAYKKNNSKEYHSNHYPTHPSWDNRILYVQQYDNFCEELINRVLLDYDINSLNQKEIKKIYNFFGF